MPGHCCFDPADSLLHDSFCLPGTAGVRIFIFRDAKDQHCPHSRVPTICCYSRNTADRVAELAGHGFDREGVGNVLIYKKRGNKIIFRQGDLAQERLDMPCPRPPHPSLGKHALVPSPGYF